MLKVVIFDMDGVIFDSEEFRYRVVKKIMNDYNIEMARKEYDLYVGGTLFNMWSDLKDKYSLDMSVNDLIQRDKNSYYDYLLTNKDLVKSIKGIDALINKLTENGFYLAIASSSPMGVIKLIIDGCGLTGYFKMIVSGDDIKNSKPDPEIFVTTARRIGVNCEECIVIEDSTNGVMAAKAAGMRIIGYINKNSGNQDLSKADIIIDSFLSVGVNEIANMLK